MPMDFFPHAYRPQARRWAFRLLHGLALAWLAWVLAQWTWLLWPSPPTIEPPTPVTSPLPSPISTPRTERIDLASLWGPPSSVSAHRPPQETRLPLILKGVLAGQGLALIAASGQAERVFREGDMLPGGAILRVVQPDHVLLERAGGIERLALPKIGLSLGQNAAQPANNASSLPHLRTLLQSSPAELAKHFRLEPVLEGGMLRGYRLRTLRDPTLLARVGLEPSDVVLSLNGRSLRETTDLARLMNELREAAALDLVVLRHGVEMPLRIDLNG